MSLIYEPDLVFLMKKAVLLVALFLLSLSTPLATGGVAQSPEDDGMAVLHTAVNPSNNNT